MFARTPALTFNLTTPLGNKLSYPSKTFLTLLQELFLGAIAKTLPKSQHCQNWLHPPPNTPILAQSGGFYFRNMLWALFGGKPLHTMQNPPWKFWHGSDLPPFLQCQDLGSACYCNICPNLLPVKIFIKTWLMIINYCKRFDLVCGRSSVPVIAKMIFFSGLSHTFTKTLKKT